MFINLKENTNIFFLRNDSCCPISISRHTTSRIQNSRIMQEITMMKIKKYFQLSIYPFILSLVTNTVK